MSFLRYVPPMGIYQTLYAFLESFGTYMGEPGTHPWSQGFPRTVQLPGGPRMPESVSIDSTLLKNERLFEEGAAILEGTDCDMARGGDQSPLRGFFRFSFGPLAPESFGADIMMLERALERC